ncbi:hypothetical protein K2P56_05125 [Patescibacteria group bacterium]|nr:hypothetical protein [Patescibacteria group bacterium]
MKTTTIARTSFALATIAALLAAFFINPFNVKAANTFSAQLDETSGQYFSVNDSPSLSITGDISVEAWVKPESLVDGTTYYIAAKGTTNAFNAWRFMVHWRNDVQKHSLAFTVDEDGTNNTVAYSYADVDMATYVGTWVHVAATWDATTGTSTPRVYINGSEVASYIPPHSNDLNTNAIVDTNSPTYIGNSPNETFNWDGKIDDVRIWNTERSPAQISSNYNIELTGSESGLVAYWKFNNDAGEDSTANGNNLSDINGPTYSNDPAFIVDGALPVVTVTYPTASQTASGTIVLTASSTDNVAVAGVQFKVDGNNFGAEDTSAPYSINLDTTTLVNGAHTVSAVARDTSDNTASSSVINFTVNNVAPYVPTLKVRKATNQQRVSTTTVQTDTDLTLGLEGGKTYIIDGVIFASAVNGTPDIKINFGGTGITTATIGYTNDGSQGMLANNATSPVIQLTATPEGIHIHGTVVTNANGDFELKWAQNTSNVNATSVLLGSYLRAEEINN